MSKADRGPPAGIGLEICRALEQQGLRVLLGCRSVQAGKEAAQGLQADVVQLDQTSQASVEAAAAHVRQRYGRLDVLINNAATGVAPGVACCSIHIRSEPA